MAVVEARHLTLPKPTLLLSSSPPPHTTSLIFHPASLSLALFLSDSSFSLYPPLDPPPRTLPPPQLVIPPPTSSAAFLSLRRSSSPNNPTSLFLVSSPLHGGSAILLRFYLLGPTSKFTKARVLCGNHRDLSFDEGKFGVCFAVSHGVSVKLVGSVNFFTMYSASNSRICVFSVSVIDGEEAAVKLVKTAVIDCSLPVFTISLSVGFLILGEESGVRVFPLRPLVKGTVNRDGNLRKKNAGEVFGKYRRGNSNNGLIRSNNGASGMRVAGAERGLRSDPNDQVDQKSNRHSNAAKSRSIRMKQEGKEGGAFFMAFRSKEFKDSNSTKMSKSAKGLYIQALSPNKFLVLDSVGDLHLLFLTSSIHASENLCRIEPLTQTMEVKMLAGFYDESMGTQTVWITDGLHTIHIMTVSEMDYSTSGAVTKEIVERPLQISVTEAIFTSEKVQDIIALKGNSILVLGQDSMFAYAISSPP